MPEVERQFQKRQTAYKTKIKDILNAKYIKTEGFEPNYLEVNGQDVSRINIISVVVQKSEISSYKTLIIDDGTGKVSARVFEDNILLDQINVSDVVLIIGRPREFSSERYLVIEAIKKIDPAWAEVRKLELELDLRSKGIEKGDNESVSDEQPIEEDVIDLDPRNKIFKLIKDLDKGEGVSIEDIPSKGIEDMDKIIDVLLKRGDVFEVKPGKLKILE